MRKGRSKPKDQERVLSITGHKRLASKKAREVKESRLSAIFLRIFGGVMMVGAVSLWYSKYSIVPMTDLALIGGIIIAGVIKMLYPDGLNASNRIQKIIGAAFTVVVVLLIINQETAGYAIMLLAGLVSALYLFGFVKTLPGLKA